MHKVSFGINNDYGAAQMSGRITGISERVYCMAKVNDILPLKWLPESIVQAGAIYAVQYTFADAPSSYRITQPGPGSKPLLRIRSIWGPR